MTGSKRDRLEQLVRANPSRSAKQYAHDLGLGLGYTYQLLQELGFWYNQAARAWKDGPKGEELTSEEYHHQKRVLRENESLDHPRPPPPEIVAFREARRRNRVKRLKKGVL